MTQINTNHQGNKITKDCIDFDYPLFGGDGCGGLFIRISDETTYESGQNLNKENVHLKSLIVTHSSIGLHSP